MRCRLVHVSVLSVCVVVYLTVQIDFVTYYSAVSAEWLYVTPMAATVCGSCLKGPVCVPLGDYKKTAIERFDSPRVVTAAGIIRQHFVAVNVSALSLAAVYGRAETGGVVLGG